MQTTSTGICSSAFNSIKQEFEKQLSNGWFTGGGVSVYHRGELVVDLYGGIEKPTDQPFNDNSLVLFASSTKFLESMVMLSCVTKGYFKLDQRIVEIWPEFANGDERKKDITIEMLLRHQSGMPYLDKPLTFEELSNQDDLKRILENQSIVYTYPDDYKKTNESELFPPAYHAITRGLIASQIVRLVDPKKRTLGQYFREEIAIPLGISEKVFIGVPEESDKKVTHVIPHPLNMTAMAHVLKLKGELSEENIEETTLGYSASNIPNLPVTDQPLFDFTHYEIDFLQKFILDPKSVQARALNLLDFSSLGIPAQQLGNCRQIRQVEMPSSNGCGNSHSLAACANEVLQYVINSKKSKVLDDGKERDMRSSATRHLPLNYHDVDGFFGCHLPFTSSGFGVFMNNGFTNFGWGGAGGSLVRFIPQLDLSFSFVSNTSGARMAMHDTRANSLFNQSIQVASKLLKVSYKCK